MKLNPSTMSWTGLPLPPWAMGGTFKKTITTAMTPKPNAAAKKAVSMLVQAMTKPAMAGAMIRLPDQTDEFSATALIIARRSMRWG